MTFSNLHHNEIEFTEGVVVLTERVSSSVGVGKDHANHRVIARIHHAERRNRHGGLVIEQLQQLEQLADLVVKKHRELPH